MVQNKEYQLSNHSSNKNNSDNYSLSLFYTGELNNKLKIYSDLSYNYFSNQVANTLLQNSNNLAANDFKENEMMNVKVKIYDEVKYLPTSEKVAEVEYEIESFKVVTGDEATEIGLSTDESSRDEYNEYLVLTLADGDTSTFRNSHVDLFIT